MASLPESLSPPTDDNQQPSFTPSVPPAPLSDTKEDVPLVRKRALPQCPKTQHPTEQPTSFTMYKIPISQKANMRQFCLEGPQPQWRPQQQSHASPHTLPMKPADTSHTERAASEQSTQSITPSLPNFKRESMSPLALPTLPATDPLSSAQLSGLLSPDISAHSSSSLSSPALSSVSNTLSTMESVYKPRFDNRGKGRGHNFTHEQETFIAELLSDPETWALLDGPGEKNNHYRPKTCIRDAIAKKVNVKFSINIDAFQIKNKIDNMKNVWKKANQKFNITGNGDRENETLKQQVLSICHFYFVLEPIWSKSWSMNPAKACQLTANLSRQDVDTLNDAGDVNDADDASDENDEDESRTADARAEGSASSIKTSKRRRDAAGDLYECLRELAAGAAADREIKRQKLTMQNRLLEIQIMRVQKELDLEAQRIQLEHRKLDIEQMKQQRQLEISRKSPPSPHSQEPSDS